MSHHSKEVETKKRLENECEQFGKKGTKLDRVCYGVIDPGSDPRAGSEGPGGRLRKLLRSKVVKTSVGIISPQPAFLTALQT